MIESFKQHPGTKAFFENFSTKLFFELSAIGNLATGKMKRDEYTTADKVAKVFGVLSNIPVAGKIFSALQAITSAAADYFESKKHQRGVTNLSYDMKTLVEVISISLTEDLMDRLKLLEPKHSETLAKDAIDIIWDTIVATAKLEDFIGVAVRAVKTSVSFEKTLQKFEGPIKAARAAAGQRDADVKQAADEFIRGEFGEIAFERGKSQSVTGPQPATPGASHAKPLTPAFAGAGSSQAPTPAPARPAAGSATVTYLPSLAAQAAAGVGTKVAGAGAGPSGGAGPTGAVAVAVVPGTSPAERKAGGVGVAVAAVSAR